MKDGENEGWQVGERVMLLSTDDTVERDGQSYRVSTGNGVLMRYSGFVSVMPMTDLLRAMQRP